MEKLITFLRDKHALWYKAFLFLLALLIILFLLPSENRFNYHFESALNKPWQYENLIAPFDYSVKKDSNELKSEMLQVKQQSKLYFTKSKIGDIWLEKLRNEKAINEAQKKMLLPLFDTLFSTGIIEKADALEFYPESEIYLMQGKTAELVPIRNFYDLKKADSLLIVRIGASVFKNDDKLLNIAESYLIPTVLFDSLLSANALEQEMQNVLPVRDKILEGQIIISKGEILSKEKYDRLSSLNTELKMGADRSNKWLRLSGQFLIVFLCLSMVFLFLAFFRKNIFAQNTHVSFLVLIILIFIFIASRVHQFEKVSLFIIPFTIAPVIIRAFFDTRSALFTHLNIIFICSLYAQDKYEFVLVETLAGIAAIFSIANMTRRSQLMLSAIIVLMVYLMSYLGLDMVLSNDPSRIDTSVLWMFAGGSFMIIFAWPLIYVFEKLFGFVSDFTLVELSDSNNKLLRELATKAPGTFQHTLQVASMAEEAIYKVGGNPLLVRTGAMYHDIGKLENPRYFTENQQGSNNPHEGMSYEESAAIIIRHVIKGVEMAREARVPEQVIDFIRTHHGNGLTRFFYKKAVEAYGIEQVDQSKFRYPGPIPFSKETCVLMMADSVEAASRSLKNYDAISIDELVERIINTHIEDQQFINADITFREINTIKKIFKKRLMNVYHVRIEYPR